MTAARYTLFSFTRTDCCCFYWPVHTGEDIKCLRGSRLKFHLDVIIIGIYGTLDISQLEPEEC